MITIFEQIINKYRNKTVEIELKFRELWNIRNLYKIRRPDHICTTMLGVSILPFITSIVISLMLIAKNKIDINMARLIVVSTIAFCCFVIATIVNMKQRNKLKEYNHLLKDKTKTEIIVDDFKNYFIRLQYSTQIEINSKIINHFEKENKIRTKEALEIISKESSLLPNFKNYQGDEKKETEEKIIELEDKIVLTKTKIELLENESN